MTNTCPECRASSRDGSRYCSVACVEMAWRRDVDARDYKFQPGERVSWPGCINFGKTLVRWHGVVVQSGYGVPFYDYPPRLSPEGWAIEAGRHKAVRVVADLPQHDKINVWESAEQPTIVPVKDLQREPTIDSLRSQLAATKSQRVLTTEDAFCPSCGHNRDTSSVSSVDNQDGTYGCQICGATWREIAALRKLGEG